MAGILHRVLDIPAAIPAAAPAAICAGVVVVFGDAAWDASVSPVYIIHC